MRQFYRSKATAREKSQRHDVLADLRLTYLRSELCESQRERWKQRREQQIRRVTTSW